MSKNLIQKSTLHTFMEQYIAELTRQIDQAIEQMDLDLYEYLGESFSCALTGIFAVHCSQDYMDMCDQKTAEGEEHPELAEFVTKHRDIIPYLYAVEEKTKQTIKDNPEFATALRKKKEMEKMDELLKFLANANIKQ